MEIYLVKVSGSGSWSSKYPNKIKCFTTVEKAFAYSKDIHLKYYDQYDDELRIKTHHDIRYTPHIYSKDTCCIFINEYDSIYIIKTTLD